MSIIILFLAITVVSIFAFKAFSFFQRETGFLPPSSEIETVFIAYSIDSDETSDEISDPKEFNIKGEKEIALILELVKDKEFPRFGKA